MPEIEVRPAVSADLSVLSALEHFYHSEYVWQMDRLVANGQVTINFRETRLPRPVKVEYPRPLTTLSLESSGKSIVLAAVLEGTPVGYAVIVEQPPLKLAWIYSLLVRENLRQKGIGSALVLAAQDWAGHQRLRQIIIEMQSKNYPAIRMAQKLGYEFCGYADRYYSNNDIALFFTRSLR